MALMRGLRRGAFRKGLYATFSMVKPYMAQNKAERTEVSMSDRRRLCSVSPDAVKKANNIIPRYAPSM